jgi:hypothetical protein
MPGLSLVMHDERHTITRQSLDNSVGAAVMDGNNQKPLRP